MNAYTLATLLWIGTIVLAFVLLWVVFKFFPDVAMHPDDHSTKRRPENPLEPSAVNADDIKYAEGTYFDYFDNLRKRYYSIHVDEDTATITTSEIHTRRTLIKHGLTIADVATDAAATADTHTVALNMYSNICIYSQRNVTYWTFIKYCLRQWLNIFTVFLPALLVVMTTLRVILCFYTPLAHFESTDAAHAIINTHAVVTLISFGCTIYFVIVTHWRANIISNTLFTIIYLSLALAIFNVILAIYLLTLSRDNSDNTSSSSASHSVSQLFCECSSTARRLTATADYHFECTDSDGCDGRCGICADIFYAPLVLYSVFTVAYMLSILYLACVNYLLSQFCYLLIKPLQCDMQARVVLHGSKAYGYPIRTTLSIPDSILLEKHLQKIRKPSDARNMSHLSYLYPSASEVMLYTTTSIGNWMMGFMDVLALFFVANCNVFAEDVQIENLIPAIDSDFLYLYSAPSTLPIQGVGMGIFALYNIPAGTILCEHRGPIIPENVTFKSDKAFEVAGLDGAGYKIIGTNVCAYINDCAMITYNYSRAELDDIFSQPRYDNIPTYPGTEYNARFDKSSRGKIFIVATRDIARGEEIFFSYGKYYWQPAMEILYKYHHNISTVADKEISP